MAYEKQTWVDGVTPLDAEHLNHMEEGISQLSEEIPNGGGLPCPATAEVGQFIVVSAVDESGKVTATDAVTLADAEGVGF